MPRKSVFVVGLNDSVRRHLERVSLVQERCDIRGVLDPREPDSGARGSLESMFRRAVEQIDRQRRPVDAVLGFGGFPVAALVSLLCEHYGVPGTRLETIAACTHRGWARMLELRGSPSHVLPFRLVDAFAQVDLEAVGFDLPFSIRPVNGHAAGEGVRVSKRDELEPALAWVRSDLSRFARPFEELLERVSVPPELAGIGAHHCIVEPAVAGRRCQVAAYAAQGRTHSYGITDCGPQSLGSRVALRQYPSNLPFPVQDEIRGLVGKLGRALGFDQGTFAVELVGDLVGDRRWLMDVTPGGSIEDVPLFEMVDGSSGCAVALELALGRTPTYVHGRGRFGCAASFSSYAQRSITVGGADVEELRDAYARR